MEEIIKSSVQKLGYSALKAEQLKVVSQFVSGKDVFAVSPTGYGKSLFFAILPFVFDATQASQDHNEAIVIVVTPLVATDTDGKSSLRVWL